MGSDPRGSESDMARACGYSDDWIQVGLQIRIRSLRRGLRLGVESRRQRNALVDARHTSAPWRAVEAVTESSSSPSTGGQVVDATELASGALVSRPKPERGRLLTVGSLADAGLVPTAGSRVTHGVAT